MMISYVILGISMLMNIALLITLIHKRKILKSKESTIDNIYDVYFTSNTLDAINNRFYDRYYVKLMTMRPNGIENTLWTSRYFDKKEECVEVAQERMKLLKKLNNIE